MKRVDTSAFLEVVERLLSSGCRVRFRATGSSMHPTIRDGEMLDVECVELTSIRRGDVLLYLHKRRPIAHRVVQIYTEGSAISGFLLCGDAKAACDAPIEPHQVLGRVIAPAQPVSRRVFDYLESCFGVLRNHSLAPRAMRQT
jgi:signal peptidase I